MLMIEDDWLSIETGGVLTLEKIEEAKKVMEEQMGIPHYVAVLPENLRHLFLKEGELATYKSEFISGPKQPIREEVIYADD